MAVVVKSKIQLLRYGVHVLRISYAALHIKFY